MLHADTGGCAHYRVQLPARAVNGAGLANVTLGTHLDVEATTDSVGITTVHRILDDIDLFVIQRPLNHVWLSALRQAKKQGIATVVEIDDDFTTIHPKNKGWSSAQPDLHPLENYEWLQRAALEADHVTVSTPALGEKYAPHGRFTVLNNYVPREVRDIKRAAWNGHVRVGWSGSLLFHPTDLDVSRPGIAQAVRDTGADFHVVGDLTGAREALGIPRSVMMRDTGWVKLERYLKRAADFIDVGVVPLADIEFNHAKSWLKGLEFAATGSPFVASPRADYRRLKETYGLGALAHSPGDWRREVKRLVDSDDLRVETGAKYREIVSRDLVSDDHPDEWVNAWKRALDFDASLR